MKAVILEVKNKEAVILTEDGSMKRIPDAGYTVGQEIEMTASVRVLKRRQPARRIMTAAACAAMALIVGSGIFYASETAFAYSTVQIGTDSVDLELKLNKKDQLIKAQIDRDDAGISALVNEKVESRSTLEETLEAITAALEETPEIKVDSKDTARAEMLTATAGKAAAEKAVPEDTAKKQEAGRSEESGEAQEKGRIEERSEAQEKGRSEETGKAQEADIVGRQDSTGHQKEMTPPTDEASKKEAGANEEEAAGQETDGKNAIVPEANGKNTAAPENRMTDVPSAGRFGLPAQNAETGSDGMNKKAAEEGQGKVPEKAEKAGRDGMSEGTAEGGLNAEPQKIPEDSRNEEQGKTANAGQSESPAASVGQRQDSVSANAGQSKEPASANTGQSEAPAAVNDRQDEGSAAQNDRQNNAPQDLNPDGGTQQDKAAETDTRSMPEQGAGTCQPEEPRNGQPDGPAL